MLFAGRRKETLRATFERVMLAHPDNWAKYYFGTPDEQRLQRHFSYSDRIRYYWPEPEIARAADELLALFGNTTIPETLISQYVRGVYEGVRRGRVEPTAHGLSLAMVDLVLDDYFKACL